MSTPYDEVAYPTAAFPQTHPDRLATHAALFGLPFAPVESCRVLDIGCGDGANIIAMAVAYPGATFVGFDLSTEAVGRGRELIATLGLGNVTLAAQDLNEADHGAASFDYVIAHGLYSWIPEPSRDALLASIRRHLAPGGVAFVSHNALPGGRLRQIVREMLLFHIRDVVGTSARMAAARERLAALAVEFARNTPFHEVIRAECEAMLERPAEVLAHDELGDTYHPVYLSEFLEHAGRHGMQFLTEAAPTRCGEGFRPPYAVDDDAFDVLAHAQELDFDAVRPYRQNLLVHADVAFSRRPEPTRLFGLWAAAPAEAVAGEDGVFDIGQTRVRLTDPRLQRIVERLGEAWPLALPVRELIDGEDYAAAMLRMYWTGAIELHAAPSPFSVGLSERPRVSPLARLQAARGGPRLITLRHSVIEIGDEAGLRFVTRLDGATSLDDIAADFAETYGQPADVIRRDMPAKLDQLARLALLT